MDLSDFESIALFFSEEEIEQLQAAIDKRRSKRLARNEERSLKSAEQLDYSPTLVENVFSKGLSSILHTPARKGAEEWS